MFTPLRLRAQDAEDVTVLSACLQDATLKLGDVAYQPGQRRLAMLLNRFRWEDERQGRKLGAKPHFRNRSGLHFDGVLRVRRQGFEQGDPQQVLELLSILAEPGEDATASLTLVLAGGGLLRLDVECIEAELRDTGAPYPVRHAPRHRAAETSYRDVEKV